MQAPEEGRVICALSRPCKAQGEQAGRKQQRHSFQVLAIGISAVSSHPSAIRRKCINSQDLAQAQHGLAVLARHIRQHKITLKPA